MPDKTVERHRPVWVHESWRNGQGHDPAEEAEILEKGGGAAKTLSGAQKRRRQADVHGDAAELEWKVPPVEVTIEFNDI